MKQPLKGPHHFTGITRDVVTNVDFWCRVMGLRFVKNTLNFETTFRYHTYFGDEEGNPARRWSRSSSSTRRRPACPATATSTGWSCASPPTTRSSTGWTG